MIQRLDGRRSTIDFLRCIEQKLQFAGAASPRAEAEWLLEYYGKLNRLQLYSGEAIRPAARGRILKAVGKRQEGFPLQYVLGEAVFRGQVFRVTPDVLVPRPETELLVEEAIRIVDAEFPGGSPEILDLGTGSGCVALSLTLERPLCRMAALDVSEKALNTARRNAGLLGLTRKIRFCQSSLFDALGKNRRWDILVSNPPYVPAGDLETLPADVKCQPFLALDGGRDGLEVIGAILADAPTRLKNGAWLVLEIGEGQAEKIASRLEKSGVWQKPHFRKDHNGIERILTVKKRG